MAPTIQKIPNLLDGEVAFALADGTLVTVQLLQSETPDGHHIPLHLTGRRINPDGSSVMVSTPFHTAPHEVRLPSQSHTIQFGALTHTTLSEVMARVTAEALDRWPTFLLGLAALEHVPVRGRSSNG